MKEIIAVVSKLSATIEELLIAVKGAYNFVIPQLSLAILMSNRHVVGYKNCNVAGGRPKTWSILVSGTLEISFSLFLTLGTHLPSTIV